MFARAQLPRSRARKVMVAGALLALAAFSAGCSTTESGGGDGTLAGIDDTTVKIGYTVVDSGKLAGQLGFKAVDTGDAAMHQRVVQAYMDYANQNGGFGGRTGEAVIENYINATASAAQSEATCKAFTQDHKVFAAVTDGMYENNVIPCFTGAGTIMLDQALIAHDQAEYEANSPYLWSPTHPEYGAFVHTQLRSMQTEGFFTGSTGVQVLAVDNEVARRVAAEVVQPFLTQAGITKSTISYIDSTDQGTLGSTSDQAIMTGVSGGYDRVVAIGGARVLPVALASFEAKNFQSTWAVSSWDSPTFLETNPDSVWTERIIGTTGLGYLPSYDVTDPQGGAFPDPTRPAEGLCKSILDAAGIVPGDGQRANYRAAFQYCDATMFLKAALDKAPTGGDLTGEDFKAAVAQIGTGYSSSMTFGSSFGPGQYAATNVGRVLTYDTACACFQYKGENVPITAG